MPFAIPPNAIVASASSGPSPTLAPGDIVDALVLRLLADGKVRIAIANTILDVASEIALEPGSIIQLAVKSTPAGLALALIEPDSAQGGAAANAGVRPGTSTPLDASVPQRLQAVPQNPQLLPASGRAARPAVLEQAVQAAATRQNSLAPLFADVAEAARSEGLPPSVRAAVTQLLALPTKAGPVSADEVKQAFLRSGLFLETRLAHSAGAGRVVPDDLKAALITLRQVVKTWLDTLPVVGADRVAVPASPPVPGAPVPTAGGPAITTADGKPVAMPAAADTDSSRVLPERQPDSAPSGPLRNVGNAPPVTAEASKGASTGDRPIPETGPTEPGNAPPVLGRVARVIAQAAEAVVGKLVPQDARALPDRPTPLPATGPQNPASPDPGNNGGAPETSPLRGPVRPALPPPPYAGGPMAPQPPVSASIRPDARPREIAEALLVDADAALARQTLLQAASLSDSHEASQRSAPARWMFEIPLATPHGTAIAQFEIARDPRRNTRTADDAKPAWRARFSLDVEPLGPVHAQIVLSQARTAVTLWAERAASAARLQRDAPLLARALKEAELEAGDVLVRSGEPPRAAADAGRFLDRAL